MFDLSKKKHIANMHAIKKKTQHPQRSDCASAEKCLISISINIYGDDIFNKWFNEMLNEFRVSFYTDRMHRIQQAMQYLCVAGFVERRCGRARAFTIRSNHHALLLCFLFII